MGRNNPAEAKGKTERQQTILRLIQEHPISRQEVLLEHLRQEGFEVTQATISRDIRAENFDIDLVLSPPRQSCHRRRLSLCFQP